MTRLVLLNYTHRCSTSLDNLYKWPCNASISSVPNSSFLQYEGTPKHLHTIPKVLTKHRVLLFYQFTALFAIAASVVSSVSAVVIEERSGSPLSQAAAESRLRAAGITAYSAARCTIKSNQKCTSYSGILSGTVNGAITLKGACDCTLVITGGTEVGHSTSGTKRHDNGFKVDFRKNTKLNDYIKSSFTRIANRDDGFPQWRSAAGNTYVVSGSTFLLGDTRLKETC
jgi:hypothetical protein